MFRVISLFLVLSCSGIDAAFYDGLGSLDDSEAGTTIFPILKRTPDARGLALGGNMGAMENGPTLSWWNPAGLSQVNGYWTNFTHASAFGEFNQEFVTTTLPLAPGRTMGFTANGLWTGDITGARNIDEEEETFSSTEFVVGASLGWEFVPRIFSAGVSLFYLNSLLAEVNTQTVSMDLGFRWNLKWDLVNSFSIHHLSPGARSSREGEGPRERLPLTLRWAIGLPMGPDMVDLYAWNIGLTKTNDGYFGLNLGWEQKIQNMVFVRLGRQVSLTDQEEGLWGGTSGGLGLQVSTLRFDYGVKYHGMLGFEHLLGVKFALFEKPSRERLPLIDQAREWYAEGDCYKASLLAEAVKEKSPQSIEAAAILQNCEIRDKLKSEDYITLIYTQQLRGQLFDIQHSEILFGGVSRRASLLKKLQLQNPLSLTLDVGQWSAPIRHWERDSLLLGAYERLGYSAVLWDPEVASKPSILNGQEMPSQFEKAPLKWVGQGPVVDTGLVLSSALSYSVGDREVLVIGASDPGLNPSALKSLVELELSKWRQAHPDDSLHLSVLMWPVGSSQVQQALSEGLDVDVVINGDGFPQSEVINNTVVSSGGVSEVGVFRFYFKDDQMKNYDHQSYFVNSSIAPDPKMVEFLQDSIRAEEDILNTWTPKPSPYFVFLNSPQESDLSKDIFLKDPIKNFDYRVNHQAQEFISPSLSPSRQRIAFIEKVGGSQVLSVMNTVDKRRIAISQPGLQVHRVKWDPFENWIFYHYTDEKANEGIMRVRPSGLESKMFFEESRGLLQDFNFSQDARFIGTQWKEAERSWIQHWSLRSKSQIKISHDTLYAHTPEYSPDGLYLAYLGEDLQESEEHRGADLYLYDVNVGTTQRMTFGGRIRDIEWSLDGAHIVYAEGDQIQDLNRLHISTQMTQKLRQGVELFSEENPQAYAHQGVPGFLFEKVTPEGRKIHWVDESGQREALLVNLEGHNYLTR